MNIQDSKNSVHHPEPKPDPCGCMQDDQNPTQILISRQLVKYCQDLSEAKGAASQQELKFAGENDIYTEKRCMFIKTEENFLKFRNLEITTGSEMIAATESIKGNIDKLKKWNGDLGAALKKLSKAIKETKTKFSDLKDAGCKLESSIRDKCYSAQWKALTGKSSEKCSEKPDKPHPSCENTSAVIEDLICIPKGLIIDVDSLFQSSADVIGIQIFSNIDTLEPLQRDLDKYAKDFEKHIADVLKTRETDMKGLQEDLVKSVKEITKSAISRNTLRSEFEGHRAAVSYICCPICGCIKKPKEGDNKDGHNENSDRDCYCDCEPRLKDCEDQICDVCKEVQKAFCCKDDVTIPPPPPSGCDD